ncbi:MAG: GNAT family N-acetyltransferase [Chloroflexi bacterium]|nr:GNAT family N-acetyltransferase [Chloroflexota bacterium]
MTRNYTVELLPLCEETVRLFREFTDSGSWPELDFTADAIIGLQLSHAQPHMLQEAMYYGILYGDMLVARMRLLIEHGKRTVCLQALEVLPEFQGEGRGSALVEKVKEVATQLGYEICVLAAIGERTIEFYRKHGFGICGNNPEGESVPMRWNPRSLESRHRSNTHCTTCCPFSSTKCLNPP